MTDTLLTAEIRSVVGRLAGPEGGSDLDLFAEIARLKRRKRRPPRPYCRMPTLRGRNDYIGDSLSLLNQAEKTTASMILFAGCTSWQETAKS